MTRAEKIAWLEEHFRYDTANSWNWATSYAKRIKIDRLEWKSPELKSKAYDFLEVEDAFDGFNSVLEEFALKYQYAYQIGTNGRSGGYLVLMQGVGKHEYIAKPDMKEGDKGYTDRHGHFTYEDALSRGWIGRRYWKVSIYPGRGMDDKSGDLEEMDDDELDARLALVMDFDDHCNRAVQAFQDFVEEYVVEEQEIMVPKTVKVAVPIGGSDEV